MQRACAYLPILSYLACPSLPYFSTLSHKRRFFSEKKGTDHKVCVSSLSATFFSEKFLIMRIIHGHTIINVHRSSCIVPFVFVGFERDFHFLDRFPKNTQIYIYIYIYIYILIRPVRTELFHPDGRTSR